MMLLMLCAGYNRSADADAGRHEFIEGHPEEDQGRFPAAHQTAGGQPPRTHMHITASWPLQ